MCFALCVSFYVCLFLTLDIFSIGLPNSSHICSYSLPSPQSACLSCCFLYLIFQQCITICVLIPFASFSIMFHTKTCIRNFSPQNKIFTKTTRFYGESSSSPISQVMFFSFPAFICLLRQKQKKMKNTFLFGLPENYLYSRKKAVKHG